MIPAIISLGLAVFLAYSSYSLAKKNEDPFGWILVGVFFMALTIILATTAISHIIVPEYYALKEIVELIK